MSSTDNSILFSNLSLSLSLLLNARRRVVSPSLSLSLFLAKKKGTTTPLFSPFLSSSSSRSDKVSRKSPREEEEDNDAQRGRCVFVLVKSKSVNNGVQKRKEERGTQKTPF